MQRLVIFPFLDFRGIKKLKTTTNKIFYLDTSSFHLFPSNSSELNREIIKHCKPTLLCCRRSSRARRSPWGSGCKAGHWMWDQTRCLRLLRFADLLSSASIACVMCANVRALQDGKRWRPAAVRLPIPADRRGGGAAHALPLPEGGQHQIRPCRGLRGQPPQAMGPAAGRRRRRGRRRRYFYRRSVKFLYARGGGRPRGVGKQVGVRPCVQAVGTKPATAMGASTAVRVRGWGGR